MSSTVIIGAGIIGVSVARYLSDHQPPSSIHIVEVSPELFDSASGFAGGFLAKDWFALPVSSLGVLSYEEHRKLAEDNNGRAKWGYSRSTSFSYVPSSGKGSGRRGEDWLRDGSSRAGVAPSTPEDVSGQPPWLRRQAGDEVEKIADDDTTAQLYPVELCRFLLDDCVSRGIQLHHPAEVLSVSTDVRGELSSVRIVDNNTSTETDIPCTRVIVAAGAWSGRVFKGLFPSSNLDLAISSLAGHSLVVKSPRWTPDADITSCQALFAEGDSGKYGFSPEIVSRLRGDLYIAGLNSSTIALPKLPGDRQISASSISQLTKVARALMGPSSGEDDLEVTRQGLCFRPVTPRGLPIISRIADKHLGGIATRPDADGGVYVATGHGPWGISLSLGTGKVLAEMVQGRPLSADVSSLSFP